MTNLDSDFPLALTCFSGLAPILCAELHDLGYKKSFVQFSNLVILPDVVVEDFLRSSLSHVRVARRVLKLLVASDFENLSDLLAVFEEKKFEDVLKGSSSFGVFCERTGRHTFRSPEVAGEIGGSIRDRFRNISKEVPPVDLKNPHQRVVGEIRGAEFYFGLDLAGELDRARMVSSQHHAPLNPTIAAAMLRLSSFNDFGIMLDPMAGSGTILREASELEFRHPFSRKILGGEKVQSIFESLQGLLPEQSEGFQFQIFQGDAAQLDYVEVGSVPLIVTNPPYGIRVSNPQKVDALYQDFARSAVAKEILEIVGVTSRKRSWMESMQIAGYQLSASIPVDYGGLHVWIMKHRLMKDDETPSD